MDNIQITIAGPAGSGKTSLAEIVADSLLSHGFSVARPNQECVPVASLATRVAALRERSTITIIEISVRR